MRANPKRIGPYRASRNPARLGRAGPDGGRSREIIGIVALGTAIFLAAALFSLQAGDGRFMGPFGRALAAVLYAGAGVCSYILVAALGAIALRLLVAHPAVIRGREAVGLILAVTSLATLLHLAAADYRVADHSPGGLLGEHVAEILRAVISTPGTALAALVGALCALIIATPLRARQVLGFAGRVGRWTLTWSRRGAAAGAAFCGEVIGAILPERDHDEYLDDEPHFARLNRGELAAAAAAGSFPGGAGGAPDPETEALLPPGESALGEEGAAAESASAPRSSPRCRGTLAGRGEDRPVPGDLGVDAGAAHDGHPVIVAPRFSHPDAREMEKRQNEVDSRRLEFIPVGNQSYQLPPIHLLDYDETQSSQTDKEAMLELAARLTRTLEHYSVKGEVIAIRPGPVVTMYEFAPAPGTRLSKIANLSDDLAMSLEALSVRIVAPIPGKAAVGIEVPNRTREMVYLKEILADRAFEKSKCKLPLAMGKDIEGAPVVVDLAKMPHLLVAGTTGSGKSVAVNSMIASLLYNATPADVRMLMVDPKMLELSVYDGIPHLLLPVVTDPRKANLALRWAVEEMERRYDLLAGLGVRDIAGYNKKVDRLRDQFEAEQKRRAAAPRPGPQGCDRADAQLVLPGCEEPPQHLPSIVIVIDEFADLMMCAPKEVETSVARIAQKARAAGIHLILATQRPSVDVITGLIKANFPSRAAFRVVSKVDSRTILDQQGAEALLGAGDMLFCDRGAAPVRVHGCYVDEGEIARVVAFLREQGRPVYNLEIIQPRDDEGGESGAPDPSELDDMYDAAVDIVRETRQCSISMIQRRLRVGYNRAARMVERMELDGIVTPPDGTNRRDVLLPPAA